MRPIALCLALLGLPVVTGCGLLPGSGINIVPWPGTGVSHSAQSVQMASAAPAPRRHQAWVHARHAPRRIAAHRAEPEAAPGMAAAAPAFESTKQTHDPAIAATDAHDASLKRLLEWHARSAKQQAQDEKQDRDLAKTIGGICHGC